MCGISGAIIYEKTNVYWDLLRFSEIRGQDGTGIAIDIQKETNFIVQRSDSKASEAHLHFDLSKGNIIIGQNRLAIFGLDHRNDQPLVTDRFALVHNGNLIDFEKTFLDLGLRREFEVDSELILRIIEEFDAKSSNDYREIVSNLKKTVKGNMSCLLIDKQLSCIVAFARYKPLFSYSDRSGLYFFSTERIGMKVFGKQNFEPITETKIYIAEGVAIASGQ